MTKPIEEGCLCIITKGDHSGKAVTALKFLGKLPKYEPTDYWECEPHFELPEDTDPHAQEKYLLRIDGEEFETTEEQQEKVHE